MNILHSSTDPNLLTRLREMLDSSARADIAVGYFFMPGFGAISAELSRLDKVRILVGRADRQVLEAVAAGLQQPDALRARLDSDGLVQRRERAAVARDSVDRIGDGVSLLPQTKDTQNAVSLLRDMVASGKAEVRAYRRSPLHAKAYLCWYDDHAEPGSAVVGSSNLTLAGFSGNTELNVRVTGDAEMTALREWFDALWDDSEDISEELQVKLELSWALAKTPPYHVYLKALYELYQGGAGASELPLPPRDEELANFQLDAVRRGLAMIDVHGGCYIGDVVGLGKTFIGAELLRQLQFSYPNDGRPLILCPAGLKPMWELFNERFQLGAAVISHSMISPSGEAEFDEDLGRYVDAAPPERGIVLSQEYPDRGPVLVDEAHNFRNRNQRYAALEEYLEAGDHKVVLLSATPQNLGPLDIYRQLSLFLDDTDHGLPIEPRRPAGVLPERAAVARLPRGVRELLGRVRSLGARTPYAHAAAGAGKTNSAASRHHAGVVSAVYPPPPARHPRPVRRYRDRRGPAGALPRSSARERPLPARPCLRPGGSLRSDHGRAGGA